MGIEKQKPHDTITLKQLHVTEGAVPSSILGKKAEELKIVQDKGQEVIVKNARLINPTTISRR